MLPVRLYRLRRANMLAAHDRVNIYDTRCRGREVYGEVCPVAGTRPVSTASSARGVAESRNIITARRPVGQGTTDENLQRRESEPSWWVIIYANV